MTGLLWRLFWRALHFCILNWYEARSKKVFCKQTADLCNKKIFSSQTETSLQTSMVKHIFWCIGSEKMFCILNWYAARSKNVFCKQTADLCNKKIFPSQTETSLQTSIVKRIFWCIGSEKMLCTFRVTGLFLCSDFTICYIL